MGALDYPKQEGDLIKEDYEEIKNILDEKQAEQESKLSEIIDKWNGNN